MRHGATVAQGLCLEEAEHLMARFGTAAPTTADEKVLDGTTAGDKLGKAAAALICEALAIQYMVAEAFPTRQVDTLASAMKALRLDPRFKGDLKTSLEELNEAVTLL